MRLHRFLVVFVALFATAIPVSVFAQQTEQIQRFDVTATIAEDRTLRVTEQIVYDFGTNEKHGIFRFIPTKYSRNGGTYHVRLSLTDVKMDGASVPYTIESRSPNFHIRIGDADVTISGVHTYELSYETNRAINFFEGEGELYWNVTGNEWQVPMENVSFSLIGPEGYDASTAETICYTGSYGSTDQECQIFAKDHTAQFYTSRAMNPYEGLTVALRFPKGLIAEPTMQEKLMQYAVDNWILATPFIVFFFMLYMYVKHGREPKGRGTVVPQYDPPRGMSPIEMQGLMTQAVNNSAVTATIIDLARRGYHRIEYTDAKGFLGLSKSAYTFHQQKPAEEALPFFEKTILRGLFTKGETTTMEDLKGSFYVSVAKAKEQAFSALRTKGFFGQNPNSVRAMWFVIAVIYGSLAFWFVPLFGLGTVGVVCIILSSIIIAAFGIFMPKMTKEGAIALEEVKGFKWFLSVTEKDRLKFHNAPSVKPESFHEFLPYAIAFGVEEQWAKQFQGIDVPPPDYATGYNTWNALMFTHLMTDLNAQASSVAYAAPSSAGSGGSGFSGGGSGGGFGGGGGGSW